MVFEHDEFNFGIRITITWIHKQIRLLPTCDLDGFSVV